MRIATERIEEEIVRKSSAGHFAGLKFLEGSLILTHKRLVYITQTTSKNIIVNVLVENIISASVFSCLGLLQNCIRIKTKDKNYFFFLNEKEIWVNKIMVNCKL